MIPTIITTGALSWLRGRAEKLFQVITTLMSLQFPLTKEGCEGTEFHQLLVFFVSQLKPKIEGIKLRGNIATLSSITLLQ